MSSTILYGKCFIKYDDENVLPIIMSGASNCTQISDRGREIRERSWSLATYVTKGSILLSKQDIVKWFDNERANLLSNNPSSENDRGYTDDQYGYYQGISYYGQKRVTFDNFKNFFLNGHKKAYTVEQLVEEARIDITYSYKVNEEPKSGVILTTDELKRFVSEVLLMRADEIQIDLEGDSGLKRIKRFIKKPSPTRISYIFKDVLHYYGLNYAGLGFLAKLTSRRVRYSPYESGGIKKFETEKQALQYINKSRIKDKLSVTLINRPDRIRVAVSLKKNKGQLLEPTPVSATVL
jgi:hypothetical protein